MKTRKLGRSSLEVSRLAYGAMRMLHTWDPREVTPDREQEAIDILRAAWEAGYTLFDTADIYCWGESERVLGMAIEQTEGMRETITVATKCGIRRAGDGGPTAPHRYDLSREYIIASCEKSLKLLGLETIDLYQFHRPDVLADPEEVGLAMQILHDEGKVRYFGVSNCLPSYVSMLQSGTRLPLVVNQIEVHPGRPAPFTDGTLDQCLAERMTPLAWSPLGRGQFGDEAEIPIDHPNPDGLNKLLQTLDEIAQERGVNRTVIVFAWLMAHPSGIVPIIGTTRPERIREAAKADEIDLTREEWYRIYTAARMEPLP